MCIINIILKNKGKVPVTLNQHQQPDMDRMASNADTKQHFVGKKENKMKRWETATEIQSWNGQQQRRSQGGVLYSKLYDDSKGHPQSQHVARCPGKEYLQTIIKGEIATVTQY